MQGSCYKISSNKMSWNAAKSACQALGSTLALVKSQAEQNALASKVSQLTWIGLHRDRKDKSRWVWVDGTRPTYTSWNRGEPNSLSEGCGHLWPQYGGRWNDAGCDSKMHYACEAKGELNIRCYRS